MEKSKTQMAVELFDKYAERYQEKYMDQKLYEDTFDTFCNAIKKQNAQVLELACGPGNITRYLLDKRPDFEILATDLAPNMLERAKRNNPQIKTQLMDCKSMESLNRRFDGIMCGFGLPYLSREEAKELIADAYKAMYPGAVLYLSTMEDDYQKSDYHSPSSPSDPSDQLYIYYHQADYLKEALINQGFQLISMERKYSEMTDGTKVTDLILIASHPG